MLLLEPSLLLLEPSLLLMMLLMLLLVLLLQATHTIKNEVDSQNSLLDRMVGGPRPS